LNDVGSGSLGQTKLSDPPIFKLPFAAATLDPCSNASTARQVRLPEPVGSQQDGGVLQLGQGGKLAEDARPDHEKQDQKGRQARKENDPEDADRLGYAFRLRLGHMVGHGWDLI